MLAAIEPSKFDEWMAMYRLEPWGDDWKQAAMIAAKVHNAATVDNPIAPASLIPNYANEKVAEAEAKSLTSTLEQRAKRAQGGRRKR
jgi:hypothetical protein